MGRPLLQLAFIHYARWIILDWLPPSQRIGWLARAYGGSTCCSRAISTEAKTDYLRTFADVVPARLAKLWGACFGFDDYRPGEPAR